MISALAVLILEVAACLGFGALVLRLLGLLRAFDHYQRLTWSFAIGYGILGWLLFLAGVAGLFSSLPLVALLVLGSLGLITLRGSVAKTVDRSESAPWGLFDGVLFAALAVALFLDLLEGLAPPADADSLAYHFALPKLFITEGRLFFIERAMDGAVPLLNQMTYIPALALGGETAMTLWTMFSGWAVTALLYSICRRHMDRRWSLAVAVIFLTVPAVIYGGGSGQVEVRNALFILIAAVSVAQAVTTGDLRHAALAGLAVGFFMAAKYIGLLFALACGLSILLQKRWFAHGLVLTIVAFVAGGQWYVWNALHTGDPVFPMLFGVLDYSTVPFWNSEHATSLQKMFLENEQAVPSNALWLILYPFVATFSGYKQFESGRTGFGPYLLLVLPFALAGAWQFRHRLRHHPLFTVAVIAVLFYALWFLIGSSQRIRHLTPVLPLILLVLTLAAHRWAFARGTIKPLMAVVIVTLGFQLAAYSLFGLNYARYFVSGETREVFLRRNVHSYDVVPWINENLSSDDRLYLISRQLNYLLDVPYFYASTRQEGQIDIRPNANDPQLFLRQLKVLGISHLLVGGLPPEDSNAPTNSIEQWRPLVRAGCLDVTDEIETQTVGSRSLGQITQSRSYILTMSHKKCQS